ncbi:MAG TPA: Xaa-Pro peptidase family protein [Chlamydiales bacterium]|nr:Xaa-Pro peptidase family protein [Chlamydiales bacterium]
MDERRIQKFIGSLKGVDGCLLENPADLLYLTGLSVSRGRFWATPEGGKLFVDGRYYEEAKKEAPCPVFLFDEFTKEKGKRAGFDSAFVTYEGFLNLQKLDKEWIPISRPLKKIRMIKEAKEIEELRRAAQLTWKGYQKILSLLREGVSEIELALEFEMYCRKNGASGLSFDPIIAFGKNSAFPHYRAGQARLEKGQVILVDVGAIVNRYRGDMTRTYFFGEKDAKLELFEECVKRAHDAAIDSIRPGVVLGELDRVVRKEFEKMGLESLFIHSLGHGIGLETHEYPLLRKNGEDQDLILEPGMVFTIEPGLYQPGLGGVRLEDMILVTKNGCENFFDRDILSPTYAQL